MFFQKIKSVFAFLNPYIKSYRLRLICAFFSIILAASSVISGGYSLRLLVDEGFQKHAFYDVPLLWLGASILFLALSSFGRSYFVAWLGEKITLKLKEDLFKNLIHLDVHFFETVTAGEIIKKLTTNITTLQTFIGKSFAVFLRNSLIFIGAMTMMVLSAPWLLTQTLLGIFVLIFPLRYLGLRIRKLSKKVEIQNSNVVNLLDEVFNAIRTVQGFTKEAFFIDVFKHYNHKAFSFNERVLYLRSSLVFCVIIVLSVFIGCIVYLGLEQIQTHDLTHGELASFLYFSLLVASSLSSFPEHLTDTHKAYLALEEINHLSQQTSILEQPKKFKRLPKKPRGIVAVHNVSFAYPSHPDHKVLEQVTLSLAPGEKLALVGPSGAGKSTLFSLLLRFYDPQSGTIHFDGIDLKDVHLEDLRKLIAIVPQEPDLFSMSIYDNIIYGNPEAPNSIIEEAIAALHLDEIFNKLPHGRKTVVGNKGIRLSGGQKQRISIARALIKSPSLLLLDEATSHLDAVSENIIQKCLSRMMSRCTSIVIAHRLSTVLSSDRIAVLEDGKIRAIGTHAELVGSDDLYRKLASLQFQTKKVS